MSAGELILAIEGVPVSVPLSIEAFAEAVDTKARPLTLTLFRCANFNGLPKIPQQMCLAGYVAKKSRRGSTFRPWSERMFEIRPDGTLSYRSARERADSGNSSGGGGSHGSNGSTGGALGRSSSVEIGIEERGDNAISLRNCSVVPLNRKRAGRDFAFEVVADESQPGGGEGGRSVIPGRGGDSPGGGRKEMLTLAANNAREGAQWIKSIQAAA